MIFWLVTILGTVAALYGLFVSFTLLRLALCARSIRQASAPNGWELSWKFFVMFPYR